MTGHQKLKSVTEDGTLVPLIERVIVARPENREEFEDLSEAIEWDADDALEALQRVGVLRVDGDTILVADAVPALVGNVEALLDEARTLLQLAANVKSGQPAAAGADMIGAVVRDHDGVWESWWKHHSQLTPKNPGVVTPDAVMLKNQVLADIDRVSADFTARNYHMRCLLDIEECADEEGNIPEWLQTLIKGGVEIRAMVDPPSWFYIDRDVTGGIPLTWGQGNPAGMVVINPSPVLTMAAAYFESLWNRATPIRIENPEDEGWESVLHLLEAGLTDKQVADRLNIAHRTLRRRLSQAMDALGANTRFELGHLWAGRQQRGN